MNSLKLIIASLIVMLSCVDNSGSKTIKTDKTLIQIIDSLELGKKELHLKIDKSDNKLYVMHQNEILKDFSVVFGNNFMEDKLMEGDVRTPEGNFKIRDLYSHQAWSKFIWIDYPNEKSWEKHNKAKAVGKIPQDASIGGEIGIHGVPEGKDYYIDNELNWTLGCISMKNKNIDDLYSISFSGMDIIIQK